MGKVKNNEGNVKKKIQQIKYKKQNFVLIIISIIVAILFFVICFVVSESSVDDTCKIAKKLYDELDSDYDNITLVEKDKDKDFKYSYIYSTLIYVDGKKEDNKYAISIERYNSNIEAKKKAEFIKSFNKLIHEKFDNTIVERYDDFNTLFVNKRIVIKGKYLFSINSEMKNQKQINKYINEIIKNYDISDENKIDKEKLNSYWNKTLKNYSKQYDSKYNKLLNESKKDVLKYVDKLNGCTGNKCDELLSEVSELEKYKDLSAEIEAVKNKYTEIIKGKEDVANSINSSISNVKNSLNQDEYDSIKKRIDELNDSYYDKYKENWNSQLSLVEENVYKNSCSQYSYQELLRNPSNYLYKKAYFFGQVLQKVSSTQYRVGIDCTKYNYISGYHCDNTIYVTYYGETSLIENDMINMWGTMNGTKSYTTVLGASVTIPRFDAKYISVN